MVNRGTATAGRPTEQIGDREVLEKLREILEYGYGRLEVVVRDHQIGTINWQKSMIRGGGNRESR